MRKIRVTLASDSGEQSERTYALPNALTLWTP